VSSVSCLTPTTGISRTISGTRDFARGTYVALLPYGAGRYRERVQVRYIGRLSGSICTDHYGGNGLSVSATTQLYLREHILPHYDGYRLGTSRVKQWGGTAAPSSALAAAPGGVAAAVRVQAEP
jgi:hypothetical protein